MVDYELNYEGILSVFCILFGIADLTRPQLPKCNNHLVSFIKVDGLSYPSLTLLTFLTPLKLTKKCFGATQVWFLGHTEVFQVFLDFFGARRSFFRERRACRGATCHTPRSDFRVASQAMVGVGFGV